MATTTKDTAHDMAKQLCDESELRYTPTRRRIVETLTSTSTPLTIEQILELNPKIAQSSLYRNIETLTSAQVVKKLTFDSEATRFEVSEDLGHHHHHMICTKCRSVEDFELKHSTEKTLDAELTKAAQKLGFAIDTHTLDLHGICQNCSLNDDNSR